MAVHVIVGLNAEQWLTLTTEFEQHFNTAVGSEHMLQQFKQHTEHQRFLTTDLACFS
jgi:hypothetical protein